MIRVLIVDDEPIARAGIAKLLSDESDMAVIGECRDGAEAIARIRADRPDLVFLDVQMPERTGLEVLSGLEPQEVPPTIFVTAYDAYALAAFEASAVDYLLKPFDRERFARALARARRFLAADRLAEFQAKVASVLRAMASEPGAEHRSAGDRSGGAPSLAPHAVARPSPAADSRLLIRTRGRISFVAQSDIQWVETERNNVRVCAKGAWHTVREPLAAFAKRLDPARFVQVSRSCLVNLDRVREFRRQTNGQYLVILDDGQRLVASRRYGAKLAPAAEDDEVA